MRFPCQTCATSFEKFLGGRHGWILFAILFCVCRYFQYQDIPFNLKPLFSMHSLDIEILRSHLAEGLLYLHCQPPLFNLILGLGVKWLPAQNVGDFFAGLYFLMSLGSFLMIYFLMKRFRIHALIILLALGLYLFHDPVLRAERYLIYTLPVLFLLLLSMQCLSKWASTGCRACWWVFLASLCLTVWMRSFYHAVAWLLPLLALTLVAHRLRSGGLASWRHAAPGLLLIFLVALAPYLKNAALFNHFTASSWFGMNLIATTAYVPAEDREALLKEGKITGIVNIPRFSGPEVYFTYFGRKPQTGKPPLDAPSKSTGKPNYNNLAYVWAAEEYQTSALAMIKAHPSAYLKSVLNQMNIYFSQSPRRIFTPESPYRAGLDNLFNPFGRDFHQILLGPLLFGLLYFAIIFVQCREGIMPQSGWRDGEAWARSFALLFSAFQLLYTLTVASLFELGEGCFMRIPVDPLILIGACFLLQRGLERGRYFCFSDRQSLSSESVK